MKIVQYTSQMTDEWDAFVRESKNGTFLLERNFMDYHSDRFSDCSLMLYEDNELVGLFPANWDEKQRTVHSHQGLTYGGLIIDASCTMHRVMEMMQAILLWCIDYLQAERLVYKPIPYIYSTCAAEEDLYALFKAGAKLKTRGVSTVIQASNPLRMRKTRTQGAKKAIENGLYIDRMQEEDWDALKSFWAILTDVLERYHGVRPTHTFEEMQLLMTRFPQQIKLFLVRREKEILAGGLMFITRQVAHTQYLATSDAGRELGALDLLLRHLISERFKQFNYFDFGISTEEGGHILNEGLIFQKEGFGGRAVCYDSYEVELDRTIVEQMLPNDKEVIARIKFLDLKRVNASFEPQLSNEVTRAVRSGQYLMGHNVRTFEDMFARYTGARHCILCGNGLEALTLILRSYKKLLAWNDDAEVIVPANTFIASILAIKEAGLHPVLCEPSIEDYLIDVENARAAITDKTVAIMPVHLYGQLCDMKAINALAAERNLIVVEDAAQAHGAEYKAGSAGHLGHAAGFSFYPGKNLGALGDAGCVTTDDDALAEMVRKMANYGAQQKYVHEVSGMNSRTDELQAAALCVKLPRLDADNERRREIARRYIANIDNPLITLPKMPKDERMHVFHVFPVRCSYREQLMKWLDEHQVETLIHYPTPPHKQQALSELVELILPTTEMIHREEVSLPISPVMTDAEVEHVITAVNLFNPKA